jgi:TolA-binding protein
MLNNEQEAKSIYEKIIKEYPNTPFGDDSKNCLKNLGKTDEQLVEEFLKKNK